jgi:hypothetical protein
VHCALCIVLRYVTLPSPIGDFPHAALLFAQAHPIQEGEHGAIEDGGRLEHEDELGACVVFDEMSAPKRRLFPGDIHV